jgi:hypothetical protein
MVDCDEIDRTVGSQETLAVGVSTVIAAICSRPTTHQRSEDTNVIESDLMNKCDAPVDSVEDQEGRENRT